MGFWIIGVSHLVSVGKARCICPRGEVNDGCPIHQTVVHVSGPKRETRSAVGKYGRLTQRGEPVNFMARGG